MNKTRKRLLIASSVLSVLIAGLLLLDWNLLRGPIERRVQAATGRQLDIRGDLDVDLGWHPRITLHDLVFANAAWSRQPVMARVRRLDLQLDLRSLWSGPLRIERLSLLQPQLLLERNAQGQVNWQLKASAEDGPPPRLERLEIRQGQLLWQDAGQRTAVQLLLNSQRRSGRDWIQVDGRGHYHGLPARIEGALGAVRSRQELQQDWPLDIRLSAGDTRLAARGVIRNVLQLQGLDLQFDLAGANLADLYRLTQVPLPPTAAYRLRGHLRQRGAQWHLTDFSGKVGRSDVRGDFRVDRSKPRQLIRAQLESRRLDLRDLSGFIGARNEQGRPVRPRPGRVLPDEAFNLDKLQAADMDVQYRAGQLLTERWPLHHLHAHLRLSDGRLRFEPLSFGVAGGELRLLLDMNARAQPMITEVDIRVRRLRLDQVLHGLKLERASTGLLGGQARLAMRGNSAADMLATANGQVGLIMRGGSISVLALRLANLDLANALLVLLRGDRQVPVRCLVGDFKARDGVLTARTLVLDSEKEVIFGSGTIDLRNERLNLQLRADAKDVSLAALRGPIRLHGTLAQPEAEPDLTQAAGRTAAAVALGSIAGPLALLPLIETGNAEDQQCGRLIERSRQRADKEPPPAKPAAGSR